MRRTRHRSGCVSVALAVVTMVASAATGSVATASPGERLFAAGMTGTSFSAAGTGYTTRVITTPDGDLVEDAVAASAGSYAASASLGSGTWVMQLAAFRAP